MEIEVLYHGTKFKKTASKILKEGFKEWSYFAKDLNTAIGQGGKYVFEVVFFSKNLPNYWQVRCENKVSAKRIVNLKKYTVEDIFLNKLVSKNLFSNAMEFSYTVPYVFKESEKEIQHLENLISLKKM